MALGLTRRLIILRGRVIIDILEHASTGKSLTMQREFRRFTNAGGLRASQFGQATVSACRPAHQTLERVKVLRSETDSKKSNSSDSQHWVSSAFASGSNAADARIPTVALSRECRCNPDVGQHESVSGGVGFDHRACDADKPYSDRRTQKQVRDKPP